MTRNTLHDEAAAEAMDALRLEIDELSQRIQRQQKRVEKIQATTAAASRKSEPKPAAESQATLADMIKRRDGLEADLKRLEAAQSGHRA